MRYLIASLAIIAAACSAPQASEAQDMAGQPTAMPVNAPAWVRVDGVAEDDRLNVRAEPDASSAIVDTLFPEQGPLEIVATRQSDGGSQWGLIAAGEGSGWINLDFTAPIDLVTVEDSPVPMGTVCHGTEPFWSLGLAGNEAVFSNFEVENQTYTINESESAMSRPYPWMFGLEHGGVALVTPEQCSDGMSDMPYAWSVLLVIHDETGHALYEGCCRLEIREEPQE